MRSHQQRDPGSVVIFEYISGGGFLSGSMAGRLAGEGLAMAETLFTRLSDVPAISTSILLREDLCPCFNHEAGGKIIPVFPGDGAERFIEECHRSEFALLIAPESDGLSECLSRLAAETGVLVLGSDPRAVELASNKALLMGAIEGTGVQLPRWCVAREVQATLAAAEDIGFPVAAKPLQGTSCEGSAVFFRSGDIESFFATKENGRVVLLLQSLIQGDAMSLSLVVNKSGKARLLSVNRQDVILSGSGKKSRTGWQSFVYCGGTAGIDESLYSRGGVWGCRVLEELGQKVVSSLPGTMGFVGVDFIMSERGPVVIEVNPRLTTPLAVAGAKASWNIGEILLDACVHDSLPEQLEIPGIPFRKDEPVNGLSG